MKQYPNDNQKHQDAYGVIAKRHGVSEREVRGTAIDAF